MAYDPQKKQAILAARKKAKQQKARETIRKNNTGKNKGQAANTIKNARNMIESATPWGFLALLSKINLSDWPYALALVAAIFKDIMDFMEATGFGYAIVLVLTFMCSIWIAMMMLLASGGKGRQDQKIIRSWLILLSGTTAELIFGIDVLPIETLTVLIIFALALLAKQQAAKAEKAKKSSSQEAYA